MSTNNDSAGKTENLEKIDWPSSTLNYFKRYDGPYIKEQVELGNHPLRKILQRQFEYMSRNLNFISAWGRYLLGNEKEEEVVKAEDIAARTIQNAMDSIRRRNEQATVLLNNSGINDTALYGKKQAMILPVTTPGAKLYIRLLVEADRFYSLNSLLWFHGEIDNKMRFANESEVRKEVQNVVRGVAGQFGFILNKVHAKNPKEAARAGQHDEAQLAKEAEKVVSEEMGPQSMISNVSNLSETDASAAEPESAKTKRTRKSPAAATAA